MSTIVGTNIEVTNLKYDSDTTSMIISNAGAVTVTLEGSSNTAILHKSLAKLTVNAMQNGAISAAASSLNVSSVSDGGTGLNTISAVNGFSENKAAIALGTIHDGSYNRGININNTESINFITRAFRSSTGALTDGDADTAVAIFGDLA